MIKIATPISELFRSQENARKIMANSDCLECRDESIKSDLLKQELFHCDLQPIHKLSKLNFRYLEFIRENKPALKLLTFHVASSCKNPVLKRGMFIKRGAEYTKSQALKNAKANFTKIKRVFGKGLKFAIENTNFYPTDAYKYITEADFISKVVYENNINFLFDIAHARITAHNKGIDYDEYKQAMPIDRIIQIHLSAYQIRNDGLAFDAHNCPGRKNFVADKEFLKYPRLQYLTVEYYKDTWKLIKSLKLLKELL